MAGELYVRYKMKKTTLKRVTWGVIVLYFFSYLILTLNGHYAATARGLIVLKDGSNALVPKYGYYWFLPGDYDCLMNRGYSVVGIVYFPLLYLDRILWHSDEKVESMRYPIRGYFDYHTEEFRDIP